MVLVSFGGHGLARLDLAGTDAGDAYTLVSTVAPRAPGRPEASDGLIVLDEARIYASGYRYEDLTAAADVVVTKPGYGIIAESAAHETAMLYTSRGRFLEYEVLVAAMPSIVRCRYISHGDLFAGRWREHLDGLLAQPGPSKRARVDGAGVVAGILLDYV